MTTLADRINLLMQRKHLSNAELARAADVKPSSVSAWLDGKSKRLKADSALELSKNLNISLTWLVTGKGDPDLLDINVSDPKLKNDQTVFIAPLIASNTSPFDDANQEMNAMIISQNLVNKLKINPQNCRSFIVTDNAMSPLIKEGYEVLINLEDTKVIDGQLYLIDFNGFKTIRRVASLLKGGFFIRSDQGLKGETFSQEESENLKIIGKVIYITGIIE